MIESSLRAGLGRVRVTPERPVRMAGYAQRTSPSQGVLDHLYVNAVALTVGEETALLLALDVCALDQPDADWARQCAAEAAGVPLDHVLINFSHTHAGPQVMRRDYEGFEALWLEQAVHGCAAAATAAMEDRHPARLEIGAGPIDVGCNRRERTPEGKIILGLNPGGPRQEEVDVWRLRRSDATAAGCGATPPADIVLFSSANHGTTMGGDNLLISSEWMGAAVRGIEGILPQARAVFLQGCCGDQNAYRWPSTPLQVALNGGRAAASVIAALPSLREAPAAPLTMLTRAAPLPLAAGGTVDCPIAGLRLGAATLVAVGAEAFVEYALAARRGAEPGAVMALGYSNGNVAYIPVATAFPEGGYEVTVAERRGYGHVWDVSVEARLKAAIAELMRDLAGGTTEPAQS